MATKQRVREANASAGDLLTRYIAEQFHELSTGDVMLRSGLDPIHPTRVATRRLRSTLRVFGPLFEPRATRNLDHEMAWYAALLGEVRDRQVQRARFAQAFADMPADLVLGPAAAKIEARLLAEQLLHQQRLTEAINDDRYRTLLTTAAVWATNPPLAPAAAGDERLLRRYVKKAAREAAKRLNQALAAEGNDELLHRARKAAKRARYSVELAAPSLDRAAAEATINAYKTAQDVLGEHQDSVVAADLLRQLVADPDSTPAENGFTYGLLYAHEASAAERSRAIATKLAHRPPYAHP